MPNRKFDRAKLRRASPASSKAAAQGASRSSRPVFTLEGELAQFSPLIAYLERKGKKRGIADINLVRRRFQKPRRAHIYGDTFDSVVAEALRRGLLRRTAQMDKQRIATFQLKLVPGAKYKYSPTDPDTADAPASPAQTPPSMTVQEPSPAPPKTVYRLVDDQARFGPLIRYLLDRKNNRNSKRSSIRKLERRAFRLSKKVPMRELVEDALRLGMIQRCPDSPNEAVTLSPGASFTFE